MIYMKEIIHQILLGFGSILLAPADRLPPPSYRITLPPDSATQAIGFDFSNVARDFIKATDTVENQRQLEFGLKCERQIK